MRKTAVMIVDESALVRHVLAEQLHTDPGIEVIAVAPDPVFARQHLECCRPDAFVIDVAMPGKDGIEFLKGIMSDKPAPVIIFTALNEVGIDLAEQARVAGAVEVIWKPDIGLRAYLQDEKELFIDAVRKAVFSDNPGAER